MKNDLHEAANAVHDILVRVSTGTSYDDPELASQYTRMRKVLVESPGASALAPAFVRKYRDLPSFWGFIKNEVGGYAERRTYLAEAFAPLYDHLETSLAVMDEGLFPHVAQTSNKYVRELLLKAVARRSSDPEGAITLSKTVLEATCKYILEELGATYGQSDDLPKLFKETSRRLALSPGPGTEQPVKQIMSGVVSVVNGMSSLRNNVSDAHAIGSNQARPAEHHATLCVSLAGTLCEYLLASHNEHSIADRENVHEAVW